MFNIRNNNNMNSQNIIQQSYKNKDINAPSSIGILLKSKNCVDRISNRMNEVGKNINNNGSTFKCIEQVAKDIKYNIENKIQTNFTKVLNQQTRVNLHEHAELFSKEKQQATKKLMQDYWNKRQENESQARRKTMIISKQNRFPKIKASQNSDERSLRQISKPTKKAIISSLNVKVYEKQKQKQTIKRTKQQKILAYLYSYMVNIIDYKVQNDTPQFLLFQKFNYAKWDQIQNVITAAQNFCQTYQLKYCTLDLQKVMQLIDSKGKTQKQIKSSSNYSSKNITFTHMPNVQKTPELWIKKYTPHQLLGLLENGEDISAKNQRKPGIRFYGNKGKIRAIIKIQAAMRGKIVYEKIKKVRQMIKKLVKIQKAYRLYKKYCKTKQIVSAKCLQKYSWFIQKQKQFKNNYRVNQICKKIKYQIHICSDSQSQWQRLSTQKFIQKQNSYLTRIFKAFNPNVAYQKRIILVTAVPIPMQVMNYYCKLLELGGAKSFRNRIIFMSPQNCEQFLDKFPLARVIYYSSSILKKIKSIIGNDYAYIVPSTPSIDFVSICNFLNVPIYSSQPQVLLSLQTNSGCKTLIQQVYIKNEYPYLPYCKNIYSLGQLVNQLSHLIQKNPNVWRWIFKIDNQTSSRGLAHLDVNKILPKKMIKFIKRVHSQFKPNNKQQTIAPQIRSLTDQIINFVHEALIEGQRLVLVNKSAYRSQQQFLNFLFSNGGILQAEINTFQTEVQNLCFCIEIQPDNQWKFISNFRKVTIKKRALCCYYDSQLIQPPIQIEQITKALIKKKCYGYFVLDFIKQSGKQDDPSRKIYFNGIKCYMDSFSSASFVREFISKQSNCLYIPYISHENIKKITMSTFFHLCRLQNISFDIQRKIGNIFMFLDGLQSGCLGMMTFNDSSKIQTFIHAAQVLDFFTSKMDQSGSSGSNQQFLSIRNSINGYLNFLRKKQFALKSNAQHQTANKKTKKRKQSYKDRQFL